MSALKTEKDFVELFLWSVARQKGHAFKISAPTIGGLPDLYCAMPGYAPVLLEAKLIRDVKANFKRTIHYTRQQTELLKDCNKVNRYPVAFGLIFVNGYHCVAKLMHPDIPQITDMEIHHTKGLAWIMDDKQPMDVLSMFNGVVPTADHPIVDPATQSQFCD